jgi:hypothetical protein
MSQRSREFIRLYVGAVGQGLRTGTPQAGLISVMRDDRGSYATFLTRPE